MKGVEKIIGNSALATTYRISPTGVLFHTDRRNTVRAIMEVIVKKFLSLKNVKKPLAN